MASSLKEKHKEGAKGRRGETVMKKNIRNGFILMVAAALSLMAAWAQHENHQATTAAEPKAAATTIDGKVTGALNTTESCMPSFTLKTTEGKEYTIHLGTLRDSEQKTFAPKVGETITVTASPCCEMSGKTMIHASEIAAAGKTYRAPEGSAPGMMMGGMMGGGMMMGQGQMGQGQMGQGMNHGAMGEGQMGQGQMGQGMMMCPGMSGQTAMAPGTAGTAPMGCCNATGSGAACQGCQQKQEPPAPPASQ